MVTRPRKPAPPPTGLGMCSGCLYWDDGEAGATFGWCRFASPQYLTPVGSQQFSAMWPTTQDDDWCGSWVTTTRAVTS
jgi:hypothetical protein